MDPKLLFQQSLKKDLSPTNVTINLLIKVLTRFKKFIEINMLTGNTAIVFITLLLIFSFYYNFPIYCNSNKIKLN